MYWPSGIPHDEKVETFALAFRRMGYEPCGKDASFEFGYQKVAIYAWDEETTTHMARQRFLGNGWLSKPGTCEDIVHETLECIGTDPPHQGDDYGEVSLILKRSWWRAFVKGCLFRCWFHSVKFLVQRGIWFLLEIKWKMTKAARS